MKMAGLFPAVLKKLYLVSTEVLFSFAGVVIARLLCPALDRKECNADSDQDCDQRGDNSCCYGNREETPIHGRTYVLK
jgi:nucleoside permease NupC